jgi:hypothetical protein
VERGDKGPRAVNVRPRPALDLSRFLPAGHRTKDVRMCVRSHTLRACRSLSGSDDPMSQRYSAAAWALLPVVTTHSAD